MEIADFLVKTLPPEHDLETKAVLKQAVRAGERLQNSKGYLRQSPMRLFLLTLFHYWKQKTALK